MISSGKASLLEMQTLLSIEDVYDILEVVTIDAMNRAVLNKRIDEQG